jgi:hypothetical protein
VNSEVVLLAPGSNVGLLMTESCQNKEQITLCTYINKSNLHSSLAMLAKKPTLVRVSNRQSFASQADAMPLFYAAKAMFRNILRLVFKYSIKLVKIAYVLLTQPEIYMAKLETNSVEK